MNTEIKTYLNSLNYDELREYLKARKAAEVEERKQAEKAANLAIAEAIKTIITANMTHIFNRPTDLAYAVSCELNTPISREKMMAVIHKYPYTRKKLKNIVSSIYLGDTTQYGSPEVIKSKKAELGL